MYTLRRSDGLLLGPINRWIYASFAPKEHALHRRWFQMPVCRAGSRKERGRSRVV